MKNKGFLTFFGTIVMLLLLCCRCSDPNDVGLDSGFELSYSSDTISFDTVFTSLGTTTKKFKIYNKQKKDIQIASIDLAGGQSSVFTMNVDGKAGRSFQDISIASNDSLFVFVKATINPTVENQPFFLKDSIVITLENKARSDVKLLAWGQNAHFHIRELLQGHHVWKNDKPHVIYDFVVVDDTLNSSLTIEAGASIFFHKNAVLAVDSSASLRVNGTLENLVTFQGDRREPFYQDVPGQWAAIWLTKGSVDNEIHHAIIRNGVIGIRVDSMGASTNPTLLLTNTIINNMQGYGLLAQGANVHVRNCVISNCGQEAVYLNIGGSYDFRHCSIGNFSKRSSAKGPCLTLNNYYLHKTDTIPRDLDKAYFGNCLVWGKGEAPYVSFRSSPSANFQYQFDHSLLSVEDTTMNNDRFINCIYKDPLLIVTEIGDFHLDTIISPAVNNGSMNVILQTTDANLQWDLDGVDRTTGENPDIGAYTFVEKYRRKFMFK